MMNRKEYRIMNVTLLNLQGQRFMKPNESPKAIRIEHSSSVSSVKKINNELVEIEFKYGSSYGTIANIQAGGVLEYRCDANSIADYWASNKKLDEDIASQVHTSIMAFTVPLAVAIARELHLPPPIPLPRVSFKQKRAPADVGIA